MNVNWMLTAWNLRGRKSLWALQISLYFLVRFHKAQETFPSVSQALCTFETTAAISASVERVTSKVRVPKVPCSIPAASYA